MITNSNLSLTLTPDNPSNCDLTDAEIGKVVYHVFTVFDPQTTTIVENAAGEKIASWEWSDVRSDVLTLGNAPPVSSSVWLKKSMVPFKDTVIFTGTDTKTYKWKGNSLGSSLELFSPDDKSSAIARFTKSYRVKNQNTDPPTYTTTPSQLVIAGYVVSGDFSSPDHEALRLQDLIVVSFLMLEKSKRARDKSVTNRGANVICTLAMLFSGGLCSIDPYTYMNLLSNLSLHRTLPRHLPLFVAMHKGELLYGSGTVSHAH